MSESLFQSIEYFSKLAGILEVPEKMLTEVSSWARSIYCMKVLDIVKHRMAMFKRRDEVRQEIIAMDNDPWFEQLAIIVRDSSTAGIELFDLLQNNKDIHIAHFDTETNEASELRGNYDRMNAEPALRVALRPMPKKPNHPSQELFYLVLDIDYLADRSVGSVRIKEGIERPNLSKQEVIRILDKHAAQMDKLIKAFQHFILMYEILSDFERKQLSMVYGLCIKNIKEGTKNPTRLKMHLDDSKYFTPEELRRRTQHLEYLSENKRVLQQLTTINCTFVFSISHAKQIHSSSDWSGLWNGSLYIYDDPENGRRDFSYASPQELQSRLDDIGVTVAHELRHMMQERLALIKKLPGWGGLPSPHLQSPQHDMYGYEKPVGTEEATTEAIKDPEENRLPHELRDVEFYPRLADNFAEYKQVINQVPLKIRPLFFDAWVARSSLAPLISAYQNAFKDQHGRFPAYSTLPAGLEMAVETSRRFFGSLRNSQPKKYNKAASELYKAVSSASLI